MSIHTPDVCYGASGYNVGHTHERVDPGVGRRVLDRRRGEDAGCRGDAVTAVLGLDAGSGWKAVDDARQMFPRVPVLYKLYVIRELNGSGAEDRRR